MWLPTIVKEFDSPDLHMKEKDAIYACLPIITAATKGDLDKEIALKWIEHLLNLALDVRT